MTGRRPAELTGTLLGPERHSAGDEAERGGEWAPPAAPRVDPTQRQPFAEPTTGGPMLGWRNAILFGAISGLALAVAVVAGSLLTEDPAPKRPSQIDSAAAPDPPAGKTLLPARRETEAREKVREPKAEPPARRNDSPRGAVATRNAPPPPPPAIPVPRQSTASPKPLPAKPPLPPGANLLARPKPAPVKKLAALPDAPLIDPQPPKPKTKLEGTAPVSKEPPIPPMARRKPVAATTAFAIQLSALRSESAAKREVARLRRRYQTLLDGRELRIRPTRIRGATVYRVHLDGFRERTLARKVCERMRRSRQNCLVVRP